MSTLLQGIDARARLAGTNKLEILMFTLGRERASGQRETYGINVFKVREVIRAPALTRAPDRLLVRREASWPLAELTLTRALPEMLVLGSEL